ncbi:MAG TPA: hypothetical protein PLH55_05960 [Spirochaetales bacterium]|nr:hypothetical protein [Spirochaetales bacterium]
MGTKAWGASAPIALIALASLLPLAASAAPPASPFSAEATIDWTAGTLSVDVELDLAAAGIRLPSGRSQAERAMEEAVPDLIRETALAIALDSYRSVDDSIKDGTLEPNAFEAFLDGGRRVQSALSRDLSRLEASYEWRLADLAALYVRHSVPMDLPVPDRYAPTKDYTGIVVYLSGRFDVRGEHRQDSLRPCLFPRLYDDEMNAIIERNLLYPDALRERGAVGYAVGLDDPVIASRAGDSPLRVIASAIFGSNRTDAVISADDALKILGSPANRELARQGKVVFVIDEP